MERTTAGTPAPAGAARLGRTRQSRQARPNPKRMRATGAASAYDPPEAWSAVSALFRSGGLLHSAQAIRRRNPTVSLSATYKIRLADIDASELKQERGKDSRASLFHPCGLRRAAAETRGEDRDGRTFARMTCAGVDVNAEQVRRGWAWVYPPCAPKNSPQYALEREARLGRLGLWADTDPVPPREWRK